MIWEPLSAHSITGGYAATVYRAPFGARFELRLPFVPAPAWHGARATVFVGEAAVTVSPAMYNGAATVIRGTAPGGPLRIQVVGVGGPLEGIGQPHRWSEWQIGWDIEEPTTPATALILTAQVTPATSEAARWGTSRWGRAAWGVPASTTSQPRWGTSRWGESLWGRRKTPLQHVSLMDHVEALELRQGMECDGSVCAPAVELLTITARTTLDPLAIGLVPGTTVELATRTMSEGAIPLFSGVIHDIERQPGPGGGTVITCVNDFAAIAATTRHGARSSAPDGSDATHADRLARLGTTAPTYALQTIVNTTPGRPPATAWETTLAAHYSAATAAVASLWYPARGAYPAREVHPGGTVRNLYPTWHPGYGYDDLPPYQSLGLGWRGSDRVGAIEVVNHLASRDTSGAWQVADVTTRVAAATPGRTIAVDVVAPSERVDSIAARYLEAATRAPYGPRSAQIVVCRPDIPDEEQASAIIRVSRLYPADEIRIDHNGEMHTTYLAAWTHHITPTTWTTELEFAQLPTPLGA